MNRTKNIIVVFLLLVGGLLAVVEAGAAMIDFRVDLATPVMETGKNQNTFLKVGVKGYTLPEESDHAPVNLAIVLDRSGSMRGEKLEKAKEAAIMAIDLLNAKDIVSVVTYNDVIRVVVPATRVDDKEEMYSAIRAIRDGGRTALFDGVNAGAAEVRKFLDTTRVNRVILLSDGLANVGPDTPSKLGQVGSALGREGISVTTIGLGLGYNEDLMTQLAGMSDGHHAFVQHSDDLAKIFAAELNTALNVVAKQITIKITCAESIRPIRVLGRIAEIRGQTVQITFNQLSSNQEKYVLLEIEVPLGAEGARQNVATVDVAYQDLQTKKTYALQDSVFVDFSKAREDVVNSFKQEVMDAAAEQVVNEMSKDVVTLRDKGKLAEARKVLTLSTAYLKKMVENGVGSPRLEQLEKEIRQDAKDLDHQSWATNRKSLRQKQYKLQNQQVY